MIDRRRLTDPVARHKSVRARDEVAADRRHMVSTVPVDGRRRLGSGTVGPLVALERVARARRSGPRRSCLHRRPLSDITNTESIESLYVNGRYYDRAARFAVLEQVEHNSHGLGQALTIGWFVVTHVAPFLLKRRLSDRVEAYLP